VRLQILQESGTPLDGLRGVPQAVALEGDSTKRRVNNKNIKQYEY
jgi:hypothetical protein